MESACLAKKHEAREQPETSSTHAFVRGKFGLGKRIHIAGSRLARHLERDNNEKISLKSGDDSSLTLASVRSTQRKSTASSTIMPKDTERESSPLTFDLKEDLLSKLDQLQKQLGATSKSEVIRHAIAVFDYASFRPVVVGHRQISVRLPQKQKATLLKLSRQKGVSVGELLRVALEGLPANPAGLGTKTKTGIVEAMKKATKKAAKKAAPKKAKKK